MYRFNSFTPFPNIWWEEPTDTANDGEPASTPAPPVRRAEPVEVLDTRSFAELLNQQNGDSNATGILLFNQNEQLRQQLAHAQAQLQTVQGQLPAEGSTTLSAEQTQQWEAYQQLGELDALQQLVTEHATLRQERLIQQVAEANEWDTAALSALLTPHLSNGSLTLTMQQINGAEVAQVTAGDNAPMPLTQYVTDHWEPFLPALKGQGKGTPYIQQTGGGPPPQPKNVTQDTLDKKYKRKGAN